MTIKIENPEIEHFFRYELKSDMQKFTDFILANISMQKKNNEFDVTPMDPAKNSYRLNFEDIETVDESANPFKDIDDVVAYSRKLRENAWR